MSGTLAEFSSWERLGVGRFMESPLSFFRMHWDHEPDWHPSPCPLPARRGEGDRRPGEGYGSWEEGNAVGRFSCRTLIGRRQGDASTLQASPKYFPLPTTKEWGEGQGEGKSDDQ